MSPSFTACCTSANNLSFQFAVMKAREPRYGMRLKLGGEES